MDLAESMSLQAAGSSAGKGQIIWNFVVGRGREAVEPTTELTPEIAVLDVTMPELNGIEAARQIQKASPNTAILILSVHHSAQLVRDVVEAGVRGYVEKSDFQRDLVTAIEALANHQPFFTTRSIEVVLSSNRAVLVATT